jgi:4-diphosphocytidyl-2-C-methyl-D-erythritol kinase
MISFPNAKINLGLDITERRNDGFHNISSCLYPIPLHDVLEINLSDKFSFELSGWPVPGDKNHNLVVKAYKLLKKDFDLPNIAAHLHKNIPLEAGLGGGSSDGSFALHMLNEFFELFLSDSVLEDYAGMLGSDCPFFIYNKPALVSGRGEEMKAFNLDLKGYYLYLVKADISISTQEAYRNIHAEQPQVDISVILSGNEPGSWAGKLKNDFEKVVFHQHPELSEIKKKLYSLGALYASLTGSGSALYGIFKDSHTFETGFPGRYYEWSGEL